MPDFKKFILVVKESNKTLFAAEKIQLKPSSLESQLERAFWAGFRYCEELKKDSEKLGSNNDLNDLFGGIFGRKK